jgi:hypothetical protein
MAIEEGMMSLEEVAGLLRDMGDAEGIAWACDMFGARGSLEWPPSQNCAVAVLARKLTGDQTACVGISYLNADNMPDDEPHRVGEHLADFTREFDGGRWPELLESN